MKIAVDTGGTFTDLVVAETSGELMMFKSATTPDDPVRGILDVLDKGAAGYGVAREDFLAQTDLFIHGTTRAINAILTGTAATTAFLVTEGHPDILVFREGGRTDPFNFTRFFPPPYISRALTFEIPERIGAEGDIVKPLDEAAVASTMQLLRKRRIEAVAVCLLWSIVNPVHEQRVGELLDQYLPSVPYTLSHQLNPIIREYRRASATAIDASLKPVMTHHLVDLEARLRASGFSGRLLVVSSGGGVLDAGAVANAPIHMIASGPAMAPVAGRHYAALDGATDTAIVADTGGTSYDVSLVRRGLIPWTRETWIGPKYEGHITGFASVDVRSIGAGGGSIAWVEGGRLLRVGPRSAGAMPGPVCYGLGGTEPTVSDAAVALGYLDPDYFLGGTMRLDVDSARAAIRSEVADELGLDVDDAAEAIVRLATERMVQAIEEITLNQGIDPRSAVLVGGGGAAGLNAVAIARRLGCPKIVIPQVGPVLSAAGALMSDLMTEYLKTYQTSSENFDFDGVNAVLDELGSQAESFITRWGGGAVDSSIGFFAEARYPHQIWELDVPLNVRRFVDHRDVDALRSQFHATHQDVFAISDPASPIEVVSWRARATCQLDRAHDLLPRSSESVAPATARSLFFVETGRITGQVESFETIEPGAVVTGPAIIESPVTTVVVRPDAAATRTPTGSIVIYPWADEAVQYAPRSGAEIQE
jgi:N-methylhydantoinase A